MPCASDRYRVASCAQRDRICFSLPLYDFPTAILRSARSATFSRCPPLRSCLSPNFSTLLRLPVVAPIPPPIPYQPPFFRKIGIMFYFHLLAGHSGEHAIQTSSALSIS